MANKNNVNLGELVKDAKAVKANANKAVKMTAIENFLTAKSLKFDTFKSNYTARKQDSKNLALDAPRYLSGDTNEVSQLKDVITKFKNNMFSDVKAIYGQFIAKDVLVEVFIESNVLDATPLIGKLKTRLLKEFKQNDLSDALFLTALKIALTNHEARINKAKTEKLAKLSDKAKAHFDAQLKDKFIKLATIKNAEIAKANQKVLAQAA